MAAPTPAPAAGAKSAAATKAAAQVAATKAAAKSKQAMINKYKSPGTNGFDGTQGFSKKGPWG